MLTRSVRATCVVALVVALGACGSSAKHSGSASDLSAAKASVLTAADLPSYFAKPYQASNDTPVAVRQQFAKCLNVSTTIFDDTPGAQRAHSPVFTKNSSSLASSVEIDPKTSQIDQGWSELTNPKITQCLQQLFEATTKLSAPTGVTFGPTTVTKFSPGIGGRSIGYTAQLTATSGGTAMTFYVDLLFVARDRAGVELEAFSTGEPFDRTTETSLAKKMNDRIGDKAA
ncbi:MAG TPA: hypothetical protein VH914_20600 [Acidimicrobiia bacterium]|jgi:hypothetical protein|nr:hypothetical protein [Acidimicrobiia bacterium]